MRILAGLFLILLCADCAQAHALGARWRLERDRVVVEAYFNSNQPAKDAAVRVLYGEKVVAEGRTDDRGRWSFPAPPPGRYAIVVEAELGHETTIELDLTSDQSADGGPSREEFTRTPWFRIAIGLLVITALALGLYFSVRRSPPRPTTDS